jgi:xylulokinase
MPSHLLLGIDLGTTNIKALVADESGRILSSGISPVSVTFGAGGKAEQDIEEIWKATLAAVAEALAGVDPAVVVAVGISSQGGAIQIMDSTGRPVGPVVGWQDSRGSPWDDALTRRMGSDWFVRHTGYTQSNGAVGQLLRMRDQGILPTDFSLGFAGDIVVGRLCGTRAHDQTSLSEPGLLNPALGTADPELLSLLGIEEDRLPPLLPATRPAGGLLPDVARTLGLRAGIPVGPAVHDQYAAAIGSGTVRPSDTMLGVGTAWVIVAVSDRITPPIGGVALMGRHPVPGLFGQMLSMVNGGSAVSWVTRTFAMGDPGVAGIDAILLTVPAGCDGLRFRPLLAGKGGGGLPPGTRGRLEGLRLDHTPAHFLRAAVEGLACELGRHHLMMVEGGVPVSRIVMCGKAAASRVTPQLVADTTGLTVDCSTLAETGSLGAAVLARSLLEPGAGLAALADAMKPPMRRLLPGPEAEQARQRRDEYVASLRPYPGAVS